MSNILHIETATPVCSVALSKNGQLIDHKSINEFNSHSEVLTIFIEQICKENQLELKDLNAISVSNGPGSYTGLRIGASTAKGLAYALDLPVITIDTIEAMAWELKKRHLDLAEDAILFCPMIDARRMEVYTSFYDQNFQNILELTPFIIDENNLNDYLDKYTMIIGGNGAQKCFEMYKSNSNIRLEEDFECSAKYLIDLATQQYNNQDFADLAYFEPNYLKEFTGK